MQFDCEKQYSALVETGAAYQRALAEASETAARMAKKLELMSPLPEFSCFIADEAAKNFKGIAYESVLAELIQRKEISPEIRLLLKHKAYDPGNPPPTMGHLAAFAEYARKMEDKTKWKHAQTVKQ